MSIHRSGFRAGRPLTVTRPARIHARASTREPSPAFDSTRSRVFSGRFDTLSRVNRVELAVRLIFVALLAAFTWRAARAGLDAERLGTFLHLPDLVFHEAGHIILSPFGRFVTDRKSTRLNSSHLGISYAVFCLQKKKRQDASPLVAADRSPRVTRAGHRVWEMKHSLPLGSVGCIIPKVRSRAIPAIPEKPKTRP